MSDSKPQPNLTRRDALLTGLAGFLCAGVRGAVAEEAPAWPPALRSADNGTITLKSNAFLDIPPSVQTASKIEGAAPFTVATTAPTVDLTFHRDLGPDAIHRRLWSSWGDIALASDGRVYCGIGDHGHDAEGDARCFIYCWDPKMKSLQQVVDMNRVVPPRAGQPAWAKVHARIDEGADGKIYLSCTLTAGERAIQPQYHWTPQLPGGQLYQYDPRTGRTVVFADLPHPRCTATSILDRQRNVWWCNLEAGPNALWCLSLDSKRPVFQGPPGSVVFNRNFALARDGSVFFNGDGGIWKHDAATGALLKTGVCFDGSPGMRSSTRESKDGDIYGNTQITGQLFRFRHAKSELQMLGPNWNKGEYVTVCELSPDDRFLYYLPGAHGGGFKNGTPLVQYEIATGRRKVLAFLAGAFEQEYDYVPSGTYGMKISADGATLFVNFNGHPADRTRPKAMKPNGFGLCSFAAIHIPQSER
jgi:hypothetical protein